tara:strand:- start:311 stop:712 length:402 start_codon:yes stop_codon:yes gene_type:complete
MSVISRPKISVEEFEKAIQLAELSQREQELIEYIRYTGIFSQPMIVRDLRLSSKPPALSILTMICRKIGDKIPEHFKAVREWSQSINPSGIKWDGDLICSGIRNIDGELLCPESGNALYDFLAVHKEFFTGLK